MGNHHFQYHFFLFNTSSNLPKIVLVCIHDCHSFPPFVQVKELAAHTATVNDLTFDADSEYIGSCSDDGTVVISSLFTDERLKFEYYRPMKALALDPDYSRKSSKRYVAGGLAGQLFLNTKNWLGYSKQVFLLFQISSNKQ